MDETKLPIGTSITLLDIRSAGRQRCAGIIVGYDVGSSPYRAIRFDSMKLGAYAAAIEPVRHPVRINDGTEPIVGETWVIEAVTGVPDIAKTITNLTKAVEQCRTDCLKVVEKVKDDSANQLTRIIRAIQTLAQGEFVGPELAAALTTALDQGVIVKPSVKQIASPQKRGGKSKLESTSDEEAVAA